MSSECLESNGKNTLPFVQGKLRKEPLSVSIHTECACCAQPMQIELDSELNCRFALPGAQPLVFEPDVNWETFTEPHIIDAY